MSLKLTDEIEFFLETLIVEIKDFSPFIKQTISYFINKIRETKNICYSENIYYHGTMTIFDLCIITKLYFFLKFDFMRTINLNTTDLLKFLEDDSVIEELVKRGFNIKQTEFLLYYIDFKTKYYMMREPTIIYIFVDDAILTTEQIIRTYKSKNSKKFMQTLRHKESSDILRSLIFPLTLNENNEIFLCDKYYSLEEFAENFSYGYGLFVRNYIDTR